MITKKIIKLLMVICFSFFIYAIWSYILSPIESYSRDEQIKIENIGVVMAVEITVSAWAGIDPNGLLEILEKWISLADFKKLSYSVTKATNDVLNLPDEIDFLVYINLDNTVEVKRKGAVITK